MNERFRYAIASDLVSIVGLLAADDLGSRREDPSVPLHQAYTEAFEAIDRDPHNELVVVEVDGALAGTLQLTFIPNLTHLGAWRCLIEGVRIHPDLRGKGIGRRLFSWAIARARERGCRMVQLTTDKQRPMAKIFYEQLGFRSTHEGLKLNLEEQQP